MRVYINIEVSLRDSPSSDSSSRSLPISNLPTMPSSVLNLRDGDFRVVSQTYLHDAYRTTPTPVIGC